MAKVLPPFRADVVGSLLRPVAIKEARLQFQSGTINASYAHFWCTGIREGGVSC